MPARSRRTAAAPSAAPAAPGCSTTPAPAAAWARSGASRQLSQRALGRGALLSFRQFRSHYLLPYLVGAEADERKFHHPGSDQLVGFAPIPRVQVAEQQRRRAVKGQCRQRHHKALQGRRARAQQQRSAGWAGEAGGALCATLPSLQPWPSPRRPAAGGGRHRARPR